MSQFIISTIALILIVGCIRSIIQIDVLIPKKQEDKESDINRIHFSKCKIPYTENK